ncbi:hypothetical protein, partial [Pseudomonas sp.]|uniref:hypothetical protein n=1 Tax=Pseudomonas sp. TaxID=306 RepID=UPI003F9BCCFE
MLAIGCAAVVKPAHAVHLAHRVSRIAAAARPIASKLGSYRFCGVFQTIVRLRRNRYRWWSATVLPDAV